ncbi:hypothetical protein WDV93_18015 [Pantoea ananatis]
MPVLRAAGSHAATLTPDEIMTRLVALPGIGPWTAHYTAMRALRWPDAFPLKRILLYAQAGRLDA